MFILYYQKAISRPQRNSVNVFYTLDSDYKMYHKRTTLRLPGTESGKRFILERKVHFIVGKLSGLSFKKKDRDEVNRLTSSVFFCLLIISDQNRTFFSAYNMRLSSNVNLDKCGSLRCHRVLPSNSPIMSFPLNNFTAKAG